ncbi:phytanoyl-CoA dioxygenase family protein [Alphaproteobacteria bacterium]|nr:phytanoyl-CoA dioxygenase family protein [Alphaproteobacteria bacterium]
MSHLTKEQIDLYNRNGFIAPIDIYSRKEAAAIRQELEGLEASYPEAVTGRNRNNVHYVTSLFDKIVHNPDILDAVETLIGKDFLVGGTTLFIKEPEQQGFISWHQDARYIGLEPENWVTAWLALSDVTTENGCMYMWPGSHLEGAREHLDTFDEENLLTRGQTVQNVPKNDTIPVALKAGQLSLHHPWVVHGSGHNSSKSRRIGFAIQSYIGTNVDSVYGKIFVQQARGSDTYSYHQHTPRPSSVMAEQDVAFRDKANEALKAIFYRGARKIGKY